MEESDPWFFTVVRTNGLRFMRPEKSWRPIITIEVDKHQCHETVLGVDGQNPNLREKFSLQQACSDTKLEIRVWHRPQSKKKAKKRNLVAAASHSLGELLKRQEVDPRSSNLSEVEVRLQCQNPTKKSASSRGKPQSGASLLLKIQPPNDRAQIPIPSVVSVAESMEEDEEPLMSPSDLMSDYGTSISSSKPSSPTKDSWPDDDTLAEPPVLRRRRRLRGYAITSEDEPFSSSYEDEQDIDISKPLIENKSEEETFVVDDMDGCSSSLITISVPSQDLPTPVFPSLLPQYTETIEVPPEMTLLERVLSVFTIYGELRAATLDSQYEKVFTRLQMEWTYIGGLLVAIAAVSTAVFGIAPGSIFTVDSYARRAIAASSASSGLGIAVDAWFLLRYNWADLHTFIYRAQDIYRSYFFFALSSRLPALCLFVSSLSLMLFLGLVAFDVWPMGVIVACFFVGLIMTLQFLVFGAHWCALRIVGAGQMAVQGARSLVRQQDQCNVVQPKPNLGK